MKRAFRVHLAQASILVGLLIGSSLPERAPAQTQGRSARPPTLQTVHEVFALSPAAAAKAYPIDLDVVVTYSDVEWGLLFVQDDTGTTFVDVHGNREMFTPGERVRLQAITVLGQNGVAIGRPRITAVGFGPLPKAEEVTVAQLDTGAAESHLVVTEGELRPCDEVSTRVCFQLFDGAKRLWLAIPQLASPEATALVGATVKVTGVAGQHVDASMKRTGARLFVESLKQLTVVDPPVVTGTFAAPKPIAELHASDADARFVRPVHLRGNAIWTSPGLFAIQDSSGTVFVAPSPGASARTGSTVDVIGFPSHGVFGLEIADAAVSLAAVQQAGIEQPLHASANEILRGSLQGRRVRLKARLIAQDVNQTEFVYQLQDGGQRFNAVLLRSGARSDIVGLARDSVLEVTGVAFIQRGNPAWPDSLLILVESPADITVVGGPGWLTLQRGLAILAVIAICVLLPLLWVTLLRRTVRRQTEVIRARLKREAHLENRFRRLFERNLAAVFTWRPGGEIIDCNMAFVHMLGLPGREQTIGRNYWKMGADAAQCERLRNPLKSGALSNFEVTLRRDDGANVHLLQNITPVDTAEGPVYETTAIDVTQLKENQAELKKARDNAVHESLIDPLTDLPNRRHLMDLLSVNLEKARREGLIMALLYLDLDGFKLVNDSLGHSVGDALLVRVADCLRSWIRTGDTLGRLGGDEFLVILNGMRVKQDAQMVADNLLDAINNPFHVKSHELAIGASIGISIFPDDATEAEELVQQADSAMYAAKRAGKNRAAYFTPEIGMQVHERSTLENLLRGSVSRREIIVHYQPEFELATNRLVRFEALARWIHPTIGEVPPDKFIPIAEESGLIAVLGASVMEQACTEARRWQELSPHPIQVAVNVSGIQLRRKGFADEVQKILGRSGLSPELLQIEVTESAMLDEGEQAVETLAELKDMGISLAIDDFGTGYSNLSYLPALPFDTLKIDGAFVRNIDTKAENSAMVRTMVSLAHNIGMRVVVECVETIEQLELMRTLGANDAQGFFLGRPAGNPVETFLLPVECPQQASAEAGRKM
ncbi:MAG: putative bifunctional diguanylate cyclase/phosphodiesterase [Terracidiphilus sp.]